MIKPNDRKHLDFDVWEKESLKNPKIKAEYDKLQPEFAMIQAVIDARVKKGVTQKELAEKIIKVRNKEVYVFPGFDGE